MSELPLSKGRGFPNMKFGTLEQKAQMARPEQIVFVENQLILRAKDIFAPKVRKNTKLSHC